jgi:hypothetical protein
MSRVQIRGRVRTAWRCHTRVPINGVVILRKVMPRIEATFRDGRGHLVSMYGRAVTSEVVLAAEAAPTSTALEAI